MTWFERRFMLSATEAHKAAVANKVQSFSKGGRSSGPVERPPSTAGIGSELTKAEVIRGDPQLDLFQAVISSQKQTIHNFQLDREADRLKIRMLTEKLLKAESMLNSRSDYDTLQEECELGYKAGVTLGQKKVCYRIFL